MILVILFAAQGAIAQQAGTIPQFSTIEPHEYDTINLGTLGIQLNVPIRSKAGHIPYNYRLNGASQVTVKQVIGGPVFTLSRALSGGEAHVARQASYSTTTQCYSGGLEEGQYESNFFVTDAVGVTHAFNFILGGPSPVCPHPSNNGGYALDNSGLYLWVTGTCNGYYCSPGTYTLYDISGNTQTAGSTGYFPSMTDPDGNSISASTDTLAETAMTTTGVSNGGFIGSSGATFTWTDALSNNRTDTLTMSYPVTISTAFGCPADLSPISNDYLPASLSFPDSSTLQFSWEKNSLNSSYYTGRIASLRVPTGGTISYTYSGGTHGINCVDGTPATMKRTTPDGTWTYTHVPPTSEPCGTAETATTTVQDPNGNNSVYTFNVGNCLGLTGNYGLTLEAQKQVYSGSVATANLLETVITCYNNTSSSPTNCPYAAPVAITEKDVYTTFYTTYPSTTGYSAVKTAYDTYGRVSDVKTYDFNLVLVNEKIIQYGSGSPSSQSCTSISTYIIDKPCSVTLKDSAGNILSQTWNSYYSDGNLQQSWNLVSGSGSTGTYLSKQYTYDSGGHGVVQTMTDVNGQVMNYTTTSCNNMFVTSQHPTNFSNLQTSQTWDCNGGVVTSSTDANGKSTDADFYVNSSADPYYRPLDTKDELSYTTTLAYTNPNTTEKTLSFNGGSSVIDVLSTTDSIGRPVVAQLRQGPGSSNWDTRSRSFDADGRPYQTSLPCVSTASTGCSASTESQTYDGLSRPLVHTGTGGDVVTKIYYGNDVLTTLTPAPTGENAKAVQKEFDGLGRLKSACAISTATGSASCSQARGNTGFLKQYFYDGAGRLLKTVENAQVSSPQQTRTFSYDLLGRVLTEKNPENGTITYVYDSDSTCGTSKGDLVKRTDQAGNVTCYAYDGLHRLTKTSYPSGPYASSTPTKNFVYDTTTFSCPNGANVEGRLAEEYTGTSTSKITDRAYCYSARGEVTDIYESTPNSNGYYHITKTYWEDGALKSLGGIPGVPTIYYGANGPGLDGEGRVTQVTASSGTNPVTGVTYVTTNGTGQPVGALTQVVFGVTSGVGDSDSFSYDPNTSRMNQYTYTVNGQSVIGKPTWNANGTLASLNITQDPFNTGNVQNCTYSYDDLVRVTTNTCKNGSTTVWSQTFGYDQFGNITKSGSINWACTTCYDQTTNRYNSTLSAQISYDANGNLTNDTFHQYQWDAEGRMLANDTSTFTYDAVGHMVEASWGDQYLYDTNDAMLAGSHSQASAYFAHIPLLGGAIAGYSNGSLTEYKHADWLHSARLSSSPSHVINYDLAFAPFGEPYASTHLGNIFAGMEQVVAGDEYETLAREYNTTQGRWISPDSMRGTGNKYVYADNNPLSKVDVSGLVAVEVDGIDVASYDGNVSENPFQRAESSPPDSTQTGGQTSTEAPPTGNSSAATTQTASSQQQAQTTEAQQNGQPVKEAQKTDIKTVAKGGLEIVGGAVVIGAAIAGAPETGGGSLAAVGLGVSILGGEAAVGKGIVDVAQGTNAVNSTTAKEAKQGIDIANNPVSANALMVTSPERADKIGTVANGVVGFHDLLKKPEGIADRISQGFSLNDAKEGYDSAKELIRDFALSLYQYF